MKIKVALIFMFLLTIAPVYSQSNFEDFFSSSLDSLQESNIIWLGEMHGTQTSYDVAYDMLSILDKDIGIDFLLMEYSFIIEIRLNQYLQSGSEAVLDEIMNTLKRTFSYTIELKNFFKKLYELNLNRPKDKKLRIISIDIEHQWAFTHREIISDYGSYSSIDSSLVISRIKSNSDYQFFYYQLLIDLKINEALYKEIYRDRYEDLYYLVRNINYRFETYKSKHFNQTRDSLIYENFKYRSKSFNFSKSRSFAIWGRDHIYQSATKNVKWIAARIKEFNPEIKQVSFCCLYSKSKFNVPTFLAPKFMRWLFKGDYITTKLMNNDNIFTKVKGTKYLAKRGATNISIFKVADLPNNKNFVFKRIKTKKNTDYIQYLVLIKQSLACTPLP